MFWIIISIAIICIIILMYITQTSTNNSVVTSTLPYHELDNYLIKSVPELDITGTESAPDDLDYSENVPVEECKKLCDKNDRCTNYYHRHIIPTNVNLCFLNSRTSDNMNKIIFLKISDSLLELTRSRYGYYRDTPIDIHQDLINKNAYY